MVKLFSGTNSQELAQKVAKQLNLSLAKAESVRFGNSEIRVRITEDVKDQTCVVLQSTSNPADQNIIELLFYGDALKRSGAEKVTALVPYFGYARQNIQHREGEDVSAHVIIKLIEAVGFDEVWAFDIHDEGTQGIFSVPFKHLSALPLLAEEIKKDLKNIDDVVIASPDQGGVERGRIFAEAFGKPKEELVIVEKKRDLEHIHESQAVGLYGDVKGKTVIMVDDIVTGGGTLLNAAKLCLDKGAKRIIAAVVHHDFAPGVGKKIQDSPIESFYTTDTIHLPVEFKFSKLKELSVSQLIADNLGD